MTVLSLIDGNVKEEVQCILSRIGVTTEANEDPVTMYVLAT